MEKIGTERWLYLHVLQTTGYKDPELKERPLKGETSLVMRTAKGETRFGEGDGAYIRGVKVGESVEFFNDAGKEVEL